MRGVHNDNPAINQAGTGSSPHARGPLFVASILSSFSRIIPACAGSTTVGRAVRPVSKDHPRMRGVHRARSFGAPHDIGSSPHARGPPVFTWGYRLQSGIIPACAGSTPLEDVNQDTP